MSICHDCRGQTVSYETLPSISVFILAVADIPFFHVTSDYLTTPCFLRSSPGQAITNHSIYGHWKAETLAECVFQCRVYLRAINMDAPQSMQ